MVVQGLLIVVASPVAERGVWSIWTSAVVVHRLSFLWHVGSSPTRG